MFYFRERPSMAVVLWQPQNSLLTNMSSSLNDSEKDEEKKDEASNLLTDEIENNNYLTHLPASLTNAMK